MDGKQLSRPYMGVPQLWVNLSLNNLSRNRARKLNDVFTALQHKAHWAIAFDIRTPSPGWGPTFNSYPWRLNKIAFTPEDFLKIRVCRPQKHGSYPWRISRKVELQPQRIPYFWTLPLKKPSIFITYPEEFHGSSTTARGLQVLNALIN